MDPGVVTLLHLAASLPEVDRILINPAIKLQLCEEVRGDRSWLRLMRPWYGHAAHMHVRFRCPPDQHECVQAAPRRQAMDAMPPCNGGSTSWVHHPNLLHRIARRHCRRLAKWCWRRSKSAELCDQEAGGQHYERQQRHHADRRDR